MVVKNLLPKPPVAEAFADQAAQWRRAMQFVSSTTEMIQHPSYQAIIALGPDVVPLLLRSLEADLLHWFEALEAITGENLVPEEHWGFIAAIRDDWLEWGRARGLI